MKSFFMIAIVVLFGSMAQASGPSTDIVEVDGQATANGRTESWTCSQAKKSAIWDAEKNFEPSQWTYEFSCDADHIGEEIEVVKSTCSCKKVSGQPYPLSCTYTGTFECYETVWYD